MRSMLEPRQLQEQLRAFFGKPRHTGYVTPNGNSHNQRLIVWFSREVATGVHLSRGAETRGEPSGALARVGEIVRAGLTTRVPHHLLGRPNLQLSRLKNGEAYRDCDVFGHAPIAKFAQPELASRSVRPLLREISECVES